MSKIEKLYEIGKELKENYDLLFELINSFDFDKETKQKKIIDEIKILILEEYKIVSSLNKEDIDECLLELKEKLEENFGLESDENTITLEETLEIIFQNISDNIKDCNVTDECDLNVVHRIILIIKNRSSVLNGQGVKFKLKINEELIEYKTSVYDAFMSDVYIETLQRLNKKIERLKPTMPEHFHIIDKLKTLYTFSEFANLTRYFTSEIKCLIVNNDISKIKISKIDKLIELYKDNEAFNIYLYSFIDDVINWLSFLTRDITMLENKSESSLVINSFPILEVVTLLETIINHANKDILMHISFSCKEILDVSSNPIISGIYDFSEKKKKKKEK